MAEPATTHVETVPTWFDEPTFAQRVLAWFVDIVVVLPVLAVVSAFTDGAVRTAFGLVLVAAYEIVLVARRGQTVGKMAMRTKVVDRTSGATPAAVQASLRWFVIVVGSLVALAVPAAEPVAVVYALIVLAPVIRPPLHRGLHDVAARTVVTSVPHRSKGVSRPR